MANFTNEEFEENFIILYDSYVKQAKAQKIKKAYLLGGQPGAGKSGLTQLLKSSDKSLAIISGDDFRKYHPHYKELKTQYGDEYVLHTQEFVGKMTEALIHKLSDNGYSLIIEGTLRTVDVPLNTKKLLEDKGYQVEFLLVQVRPELSLLGTFKRYEAMLEVGTVARGTPIEHHNNVVKNIADNLSHLYNSHFFSNISIYTRQRTLLYSLKETPNINPGELVRKEFERELSMHEKNKILEGYEQVLLQMKKRGARGAEIQIVQKERDCIGFSLNDNKAQLVQKTPEKIYFKAPLLVKDITKELGAKWDKDEKSWFIMSDNPNKDELFEKIKIEKNQIKQKEQNMSYAKNKCNDSHSKTQTQDTIVKPNAKLKFPFGR